MKIFLKSAEKLQEAKELKENAKKTAANAREAQNGAQQAIHRAEEDKNTAIEEKKKIEERFSKLVLKERLVPWDLATTDPENWTLNLVTDQDILSEFKDLLRRTSLGCSTPDAGSHAPLKEGLPDDFPYVKHGK